VLQPHGVLIEGGLLQMYLPSQYPKSKCSGGVFQIFKNNLDDDDVIYLMVQPFIVVQFKLCIPPIDYHK